MRDYKNDNWIAWYTQPTAGWLELSPLARAAMVDVVMRLNSSGELVLARGLRALSVIACFPWDMLEPGLRELIACGKLEWDESGKTLRDPDYQARHRRTSADRMADKRRRDRGSQSDVTCDASDAGDVTSVTSVTSVTAPPSDACDASDAPSILFSSNLFSSNLISSDLVSGSGSLSLFENTNINTSAPELPADEEVTQVTRTRKIDRRPDEVWEHYVAELKQHRPRRTRTSLLPDDRAKILSFLKAGMTVKDLKMACSGLFRSPWHTGHNDSGKDYLELSYALRNPGTYITLQDDYEQARAPKPTPPELPPGERCSDEDRARLGQMLADLDREKQLSQDELNTRRTGTE